MLATLGLLLAVAPVHTQELHEKLDLRTLGSSLAKLGDSPTPSTVTCVMFIQQIIAALQPKTDGLQAAIPPSLMNIVLNSGKGINDLGFYDSCVHDPTTKYFTLRPVEKKFPKKVFYGICLPIECDLGTINTILTPYFSAQVVPGLEKINNAQGQFALTAVDPGAHMEMTMSGIFALALFSALGFVSCVGCCFNASVAKRDADWVGSMRDSLGGRFDQVLTEQEVGQEEVSGKRSSSTVFAKFSQCFDFSENIKRVFTDNQKSYYQLTYLDGLRAFAVFYTIFGNDYWARYPISQNISDKYSIDTFMASWTYLFCVGSQYAVDVFLFISGLSSFIVYSQRLRESRPRGVVDWAGFAVKAILTKWMELAPLYLVLASFYYSVMPSTVDGPVNSLIHDYSLQCGDGGFWYSLLMFGNINVDYQCMQWCWYLGVELQAFIVALVSVILYRISKTVGIASLGLWILGSIGATVGIWFGKDLTLPVGVIPRESIHDDYFRYFYAQSFTRWVPYMLGALVACLVMEKMKNDVPAEFSANPVALTDLDKEEIFGSGQTEVVPSMASYVNANRNPVEKPERTTTYDWTLAVPCTIGGLILMILPVLLYRFYQNDFKDNNPWGKSSQMLFAMFGSWSVIAGVVLMGLPALYGKTSVALMFFGGSFWSPLSRMYISMYVIQMLLIQYNIAQSYAFQYLDNFVIQNYMFADLFFSFLLAILFACLIEVPFSRFVKKVCWE